MSKNLMEENMQRIYDGAHEAGLEAGISATPTKYNVTDGNGNVVDRLDDGLCGFAWVVSKGGNSKFSNWLKRNNLGEYSSYEKGVVIWVGEFNQSHERKLAYARAFASVLIKNGIDVRVGHRLD